MRSKTLLQFFENRIEIVVLSFSYSSYCAPSVLKNETRSFENKMVLEAMVQLTEKIKHRLVRSVPTFINEKLPGNSETFKRTLTSTGKER
jgi:hypothetical protein